MKTNLLIATIVMAIVLTLGFSNAFADESVGKVTVKMDIIPTNTETVTITSTSIETTYVYATSWSDIGSFGWNNLALPLFENGFPVVTDKDEILLKYDWWKWKGLLEDGKRLQPTAGLITDFVDKIGGQVSINYWNEDLVKADWNYTGGIAGITNWDLEYCKVRFFLGLKYNISKFTNPEPSTENK